jgi:hypothetical protein
VDANAKNFSSDFGSYQSQILQKDSSIIYIRTEVQQDGSYPAEKYVDFVDRH